MALVPSGVLKAALPSASALGVDTPPLKGLRLQPFRLQMGSCRNGASCGWSVFFVVASGTGGG